MYHVHCTYYRVELNNYILYGVWTLDSIILLHFLFGSHIFIIFFIYSTPSGYTLTFCSNSLSPSLSFLMSLDPYSLFSKGHVFNSIIASILNAFILSFRFKDVQFKRCGLVLSLYGIYTAVHRTIYIIQYTLYSVHCIVYNVYGILCTIQFDCNSLHLYYSKQYLIKRCLLLLHSKKSQST